MRQFKAPAPPYVGPPAHDSGDGNKPITRVVVHSTVSACVPGGARQIGAYFRSPSAGGSAHYVVDPNETVQAAWDSVVCWHAPPNSHSIGIEMCDTPGPLPDDRPGTARWRALKKSWRWAKPSQRRMLKRTARLTAQLCLAYGVPIRFLSPEDLRAGRHGVTTHANVSQAWRESTHWDPGFWPRRYFMRLVRREARRLRGERPRRRQGLRVITANVYRKNKNLPQAREVLSSLGADALLTQEAYDLGEVPGYVRHSGRRGFAREVAVYTRTDDALDGRPESLQMSDNAGRAVNHARYAETVRLDNGISLMSTHMNADIQEHGRVKVRDLGTREWVQHMKRIQEWVRDETSVGRIPIVGMDSNFRARSGIQRLRLWRWSPQRALARVGLTWHCHGFDGIAAPKGVGVSCSTVSRDRTGSDHLWLVVDLDIKE